jgi:hypothetical protein
VGYDTAILPRVYSLAINDLGIGIKLFNLICLFFVALDKNCVTYRNNDFDIILYKRIQATLRLSAPVA